ncbi:MAG: hypothetical protein QOJ13_2366 [Gaiellales bacterium]|nr:hypothetical protein [Gaiellales bacterium]
MSLEQPRRLHAGELDFAIIHAVEHDGIEAVPRFTGEALVAHIPAGHRFANCDVIAPQDVVGETLVSFPVEANPAVHHTY